MELYSAIANFGFMVVATAMYLIKVPNMVEKVTKVIESNTEVIRDTRVQHERMEETLVEIKTDLRELKNSTDLTSVYTMLEKLESKIDQLGK